MALNASLDTNESRSYDVIHDADDLSYVHPEGVSLLPACLLPFLIVPGLVCNALAFAILVRRQMFHQHEGFVYLGAIQLVNIVVLCYDRVPFWISSISGRRNILITSTHSCRALIHLDHVLSSASGWLVAAMLLDVYLRRRGRQQRSSSGETELKAGGGVGGGGCCADFPGNYCTLFGAGFTTGSIFFQLVVGSLWLIPFTQYLDFSWLRLQYCHIDLPPAYAVWVLFVERMPTLVLTPVMLIALAVQTLGPPDTNSDDHASPEVGLAPTIPEVEWGTTNAMDLSRAAIGVATACLLLRSPIFVLKSLLPGNALQHWNRPEQIIVGLDAVSNVSLVVVPVVCLATISGMREAIAAIARRICSPCRRPTVP